MKRKPLSLIAELFVKIAPRIGARVVIEPEWGVVGQVTYKNGARSYFKYSSIDLNTLGASAIAKDKDFSNFFMKRMGYPIVPGKTFFADWWAKTINEPKRTIGYAWKYAKKLGLPVIVKPNSGTWGIGVALVHNKTQFYRAMRDIFQEDRVALVQRPVRGKDYRIVVLEDKVISAYERTPLKVVGNGTSSIITLLRKKQVQFVKSGRDTTINLKDPRIVEKLSQQKLTLQSVLATNETVYLLDNANLSAGGDSLDVTDVIHPAFTEIAINLTRDMGLRLCGVDLMIKSDITQKPGTYWVLEINSAPGLDHYAKSGAKQEEIVEKLYLEVLKSMEQTAPRRP